MRTIHRAIPAMLGLLAWEGAVAQTATNACSYSGGNQYSVGTSCNPTAFDKPGSFTATYNPGGCNSGSNDDAWGWFTATATSTNITYNPDGTENPIMHVFTGACGSLTQVDCANAVGNGGNETLNLTTVIGTNYMIRIERRNTNNAMNGDICIWSPVPPANDDPCAATVLPMNASCVPSSGNNTDAAATSGIPAPSCGNYAGGDIWFRFTAPASGLVNLQSTAGSLGDASFAVYSATACNGTFTQISCDDDSGPGLMPEINLTGLNPGQTYYLRAWGYNGASGSFSVCAVEPIPPANDNSCTATLVTVNNSCIQSTYTNANATTSPQAAPPCGSFGPGTRDVWFRFVAPPSGMVAIETFAGTLTSASMALYSAPSCGGTMTRMDCDENSATGNMPYLTANTLVPGDTYYIRVWGTGSGSGTFNLCIHTRALTGSSCAYVLELFDTGENGWGSSSVGIRINGGSWTDYTITGYYGLFMIPVNTSDVLELRYVATGPGQGSNRYTLRQQPGGQGIFTGGPTPAAGTVFTETVDCIPPGPPSEDCAGASAVCDAQNFTSNATGVGFTRDLDASNFGCLSNGERQGTWYVFNAITAGNIAFTIAPTNSGDDYDFAVWGPFSSPTCAPPSDPARCSYSGSLGTTGLNYTANDNSEGQFGDRYVNDLTVTPGEVYMLYISNWSQSGLAFDLTWDLQNGATLDCGVLPIELISLEATPVGAFIDVNWSTATETDNERFIVQRSSDGLAFAPIGEVAGAGESFSRIDYRFTDTAPLPGINYYRLQQMDTDGSSTTTTTVSANLRMSGQAALLFPNPATEQLQVSYFTSLPGMTHLQVVDASGRAVLRTDHAGNTGTQQVLLDVSGLDAGSYLLRISTGSGIPIENARFIKR